MNCEFSTKSQSLRSKKICVLGNMVKVGTPYNQFTNYMVHTIYSQPINKQNTHDTNCISKIIKDHIKLEKNNFILFFVIVLIDDI